MAEKNVNKLFVLDTSVILFDHDAVTNFEEHDVIIPIQVLEELDKFKKGNDTKHYEARSFIRFLNELSKEHLLTSWVPLPGENKGKLKVIMPSSKKYKELAPYDEHKIDNQIIHTCLDLQLDHPKLKVILVSKDICLRVKARSVNLFAEDYETGKVKDLDVLYTGMTTIEGIESNVIDEMFTTNKATAAELKITELASNHFYILKNGRKSVLGVYNSAENIIDRVEKETITRIKPKNAEQTFAIRALMDPHIRLVTIRGVAGSGKTLLALASALEQRSKFQQIYVTRPIVPLSNKDLGFLPGDINSKVDPYMQPIWDNLKYIKNQFSERDKEYARIDDMVQNEKITIAPLAFIRGRTLANVFFIVDEAQNLTPHEVKTIITRAGENTKIVLTGDINQIDTPYLDAESNGLSYVIDKVKNNPLFAHITLQKGERSELANLANQLL